MAIVRYNNPPEARVPTRAQQTGHGEGATLQYAAFGDLVQGGGNVNTVGPNIELATKYSTAPYRGPHGDEPVPEKNPFGYRSSKRQGYCFGNDDTCKARMTERWDPYCNAHGRINAGLSAWDASKDKPEEPPSTSNP